MAKKGAANFTNQVAKQLIKEQKQKMKELEKQQKEQYINNRYEEASILTNNIINSKCREISIEEFIKKDLQELKLPEDLLVPYTKPSEITIRKANIIEKLFETIELKL